MKQYDTYKDSGIEWIGEIPKHWEVKKLKYITEINPTKDNTINKDSIEQVVFLPMERVKETGEIDCEIRKSVSELWNGFTFFRKNDVIIAKITPCFENGKGALLDSLETDFGFGSTEFHVIRSKGMINPKLLFYITKSEMFMKIGEAFMSGAAGQKRVPTDFISDFIIGLPSNKEQTAIAAYLDRKTAEIDCIIANKQKLIALYEEEKQAIINQAVTRGIDKDVQLKPSGVEWLGDIPEHWEVKKLFYVAKINSGATPDRGNPSYWNGEIPWVKTGEVNYNVINSTEEYITEEGYRNSSVKLSPIGTLLMAMYGQGITRGRVAILGTPATYNQACCSIQFGKEVYNKFGFYFFSMAYKYIRDDGNETSQMNISTGYISGLKIIVLPITEQQSIVSLIERESSRLDAIIEKYKKQIELFQEYRTTLISEVVTGKVKVVE